MLDSYHDAECRDIRRPRPNAGHPHPDNYDLWLDPGVTDVNEVSEMLKPYDARLMRCFPVSASINQLQNDDAEYAKPVGIEALSQSRLSHRSARRPTR